VLNNKYYWHEAIQSSHLVKINRIFIKAVITSLNCFRVGTRIFHIYIRMYLQSRISCLNIRVRRLFDLESDQTFKLFTT